METTVILRTILYQVMMAETLDDVEAALKVMCTKDDIAAVKEQVDEARKKREENK
jgi:hypothetical protein